jgi:hypothetical protein
MALYTENDTEASNTLAETSENDVLSGFDSDDLTETDLADYDYDTDDYFSIEDSETSAIANANMTDFVNDFSGSFLFDTETEDISNKDITGISTDDSLGASSSDLGAGYTSYSYVINTWGTPNVDALYWEYQGNTQACAIFAQTTIYESITGNEVYEDRVIEDVTNWGWYNPETGTSIEYSDSILRALDIETVKGYNNTINTITNALDNGDKVIAWLDSDEIWNTVGIPYEQAGGLDHAVWVTGIQLNADNTFDVILNDSGDPYGQQSVVDGADFMNAWNDSDNFLVIAYA